jgi:hypothetical protein
MLSVNPRTPLLQNRLAAEDANQSWRKPLTQCIRRIRQPQSHRPVSDSERSETIRLSGMTTMASDDARRTTSKWSPVINRHAIAPLALVSAQWVVRGWANQTQNTMIGIAQEGDAAVLARAIEAYAFQWFLSQGLRIVIDPLMQRWETASNEKLIRYARRVTEQDARTWAIAATRERVVAAISTQAPKDVLNATRFVYSATSNTIGLAVFLATLNLGKDALTVGALAGAVLGAVTLFALQGVQERLTKQEHQAETAYRSLGETFGDNVLLGNAYNYGLWVDQRAEAERRFRTACWKRSGLKAGAELSLTLINAAAVMGGLAARVGAHTVQSDADRKWLLTVASQVPRLDEICHRAVELTKDFTSYKQVSGYLGDLKAAIDGQPNVLWEDRIVQMLRNAADFNISGPGGETVSLNKFLHTTERLYAPGRWTIRARNGAGKSTLLNVLTTLLAKEVHYLPVKHHLLHRSKGGSAGESLLEHIAEITEHVQAPVILLDEWMANLDHANARTLSACLDDLAEHRCIIEVVHD